MSERFLFVRPPRPLWPFNGPSTAFWPPLAFASLAAALRDNVRGLEVEILDAPALEMGWKTLTRRLRASSPAYVGIGEEAVSVKEGLRLAALAKAAGARVIAGGCFFSHVAPQALATGLVDVVVHGEGEATIVELVAALREGTPAALGAVAGISFRDGEEVRRTRARPLLPDLDRLPMPAYDLLPVARYGALSRNHPALASIELGRGCRGACSFCVLWRQMGRGENGGVRPCLRTKSPERVCEEVRVLKERFGRRYLAWVDPSFSADPDAARAAEELLLRRGLGMGQSAWLRVDEVVRDDASGALSAYARAGLDEVYLGIERQEAAGLRALGKRVRPDAAREALRILTTKHPRILTVGSFIYGLPGDTPAGMRAMHRFSIDLDLDMAFYIPVTPLPGTPYWRDDMWDASGRFFRRFDFLPDYGARGRAGRCARALLGSIACDWTGARLAWYWRRVRAPDPRKRRIAANLFGRGLRFSLRRAFDALVGAGRGDGLWMPAWYER